MNAALSGRASAAVVRMVDRAVGIYSTAPTCHLSALARLDAYRPDDLDRALDEERSLVRVRAMRYSAYAFPHELLCIALAAKRPEAERTFARQTKAVKDYERYARRVEEALDGGPLASTEIREHADPGRALGTHFGLVLARMSAECRIVRATTTGGWRSNRLTYARWDRWIPGVDPFALGPDEARPLLAQRYVDAYGPVEAGDVQWWAGWTKRDTLAAIDGIDLGAAGYALDELRGLRLLPVWDVLMVTWADRDRLFDAEHGRFLYDASGNATSVVLDAGRVVGVWDLGSEDDPLSVRVAPLGRWPKRRWDDVEAQAQRIAGMIGATETSVERLAEPVDLVAAPRNRFLSPLSG